ncbi:hypothetical protein CANCADRAFT_97124 [Tortispora caseinolytica NRRL Y-17796]|uniref:Copper acquisition factor BIM1-like domain-containing protein n=1 Tax=Tortispora caseinolytica NRRL Y-17796 TaxID=767744 RepID=A0A1E4TDW4_9ASCO|nr:hypothetical protein CANCADRAFT_97124 [Tortispora caseinolytica NRRL Y-17796]
MQSKIIALALAGAALAQHGSGYAQTMGPVAFLWPPDRPWNEDQDNIAPCGSASGVGNRTAFPIDQGYIALVAQEEGWDIAVRIAYSDDPTNIADFDPVRGNISEIGEGHLCVQMPDQTSSIQVGDPATLQIEYRSLEGSENETFYACADITFVSLETWIASNDGTNMCFNATEDEFSFGTQTYSLTALPTESGDAGTGPDTTTTTQATSTTSEDSSTTVPASSGSRSAGNTIAVPSFVGLVGAAVATVLLGLSICAGY